ncbi:hypothetical protein O181_019009 [Austropuccinia psidii MF-1]|uniref:Uncharacterized protein n=1 Tax=Austropuccinia psidii MF-1 TaxID=1389203 RepID=A0A9Q3C692_9BASI|nr:hypothetical protein [Austropuccinia psidii MF-1]
MGFKHQKQNPPNPTQQDSPIPCMPRKKTPLQPLQAQVAPNEPSQHIEPPIPGPSQPSEPHEDTSTSFPATPTLVIIIDNTPIGCPHSHNEACQEFTNLRPILMIPQAIFHKSINQILLEHCRLLHMIPFVDSTHQNEMHQEFQEEINTLLGQALEAYPKEDITGIV